MQRLLPFHSGEPIYLRSHFHSQSTLAKSCRVTHRQKLNLSHPLQPVCLMVHAMFEPTVCVLPCCVVIIRRSTNGRRANEFVSHGAGIHSPASDQNLPVPDGHPLAGTCRRRDRLLPDVE